MRAEFHQHFGAKHTFVYIIIGDIYLQICIQLCWCKQLEVLPNFLFSIPLSTPNPNKEYKSTGTNAVRESLF